jgi:hypothetical protein
MYNIEEKLAIGILPSGVRVGQSHGRADEEFSQMLVPRKRRGVAAKGQAICRRGIA